MSVNITQNDVRTLEFFFTDLNKTTQCKILMKFRPLGAELCEKKFKCSDVILCYFFTDISQVLRIKRAFRIENEF